MVHSSITVNATQPRLPEPDEGAVQNEKAADTEHATTAAETPAAPPAPPPPPAKTESTQEGKTSGGFSGFVGKMLDAAKAVDSAVANAAAEAKAKSEKMDSINNSDGQQLLSLFRSGDADLLKALQGSDGSALLMKIQDALNIENRTFSMMSNLQSVEHETKKAIINNMRA